MTLQEIYLKHKRGDWPDKGSIHSYIEVYERILSGYRTTAKEILEIGLMSGESLRMWSEYFTGNVRGIDCDMKPHGGLADLTEAVNDGLNINIGDASDPDTVRELYSRISFDVVIEDANHDIEQQVKIYQNIRPLMSPGGLYIIEDVQDIDTTRWLWDTMGGEVIDLRHKKNRYDDVLILFRC